MPDIDTLIQRWQAGDERAAKVLYDHHRERVFRLAYGLLGNPSDAEEAAQDALAYALNHINRYDAKRASFATWLHVITVSRCRDRQRRRRLPSLSLTAWLQRGNDLPAPTPNPERQAILREAILLRYWAGHTYREMGEIMGCPLRTAQSRVRLAYQQLRATLAPAKLSVLEEERI
jgi:RNA polymerase sigma-70 factor, ECF subfamily